MAFVGAFLGTIVADMPTKDIIAGFPGGLILTLVGISFLFARTTARSTGWSISRYVWCAAVLRRSRRNVFFRQLLSYAAVVTIAALVILWLVFVVIL